MATKSRRLRVTSLWRSRPAPPQETDQRHPAFNKLFIESEYDPELNALVFHRRPRSANEAPVFLVHMLVTNSAVSSAIRYASDRALFLGRGGTPRAPQSLWSAEADAPGTTGATLDPILSLGADLDLAPGTTGRLDFLTLAGRDRSEVLALARRYQSRPVIDRAFGRARALIERELREQELSTVRTSSASTDCCPPCSTRAPACVPRPRRWPPTARGSTGCGASASRATTRSCSCGCKSEEETALVRDVLRAHAYWRRRGTQGRRCHSRSTRRADTARSCRVSIYRLMVRMGSDVYLNQRGGIFLLSADQMATEDRTLLETAARAVLDGSRGTLAAQLRERTVEPVRLPAFVPTLSAPVDLEPTPDLPRPAGPRARQWAGRLQPRWARVRDLPRARSAHARAVDQRHRQSRFGFIVSEAGAGSTWAENSSREPADAVVERSGQRSVRVRRCTCATKRRR